MVNAYQDLRKVCAKRRGELQVTDRKEIADDMK
jgi:hypothetical protein